MTTTQIIIGVLVWLTSTGFFYWLYERTEVRRTLNTSTNPQQLKKDWLMSGGLRAQIASCMLGGFLVTGLVLYIIK